jgi:hypothetical protein
MSLHRLLPRVLVLGAIAAASAIAAATSLAAYPTNTACTGSNLSGKFLVVPNSQGAGNILYTVQLRNRSKITCFVSGIPGLRLIGKTGKNLPTKVVPIHVGQLTAVKVTLKPGAYAASTARFSPDVPGPGEGHPGNCEQVAYKVRISPAGGGSLLGPVSPPTPVCEHGSMSMTVLVAGKRGPVFG